jgi:hypothetical protein
VTRSGRAPWLVLAALLGLALIVRAVLLPHSRMIDEVQFRSALIARAQYFALANDVPEWRQQINSVSLSRLPEKEPSLVPFAAATLYWLTGGERPILGKALAAAAWLVGGVFLFLILRDLVSPVGAVFSVAYYLFVPAGVSISTSFTSDALMMATLLIALFVMLRYHARPSAARLAVCIVTASLAIFVKPLIVFTVPAVFVALAISRAGSWRGAFDRSGLLFVTTSLLLGTGYYVYGVLFATLGRQAEASFVPQLLTTVSYWAGWHVTAVDAAGLAPLILALVGAPMLRPGAPRAMLLGLCAGYVLFCLSFTYHIRYADYYHLQLVIIVAVALAPVCAALATHIAQATRPWLWAAPVVLALAVVSVHTAREIGHRFAAAPSRETEAVAREIGALVNHSDRVVYVASYYGRPLEYMAELSGTYWLRRQTELERLQQVTHTASVHERLTALGFVPAYYVVTDLDEFQVHHQDLQAFLAAHCSPLADKPDYIVYGHCRNQT